MGHVTSSEPRTAFERHARLVSGLTGPGDLHRPTQPRPPPGGAVPEPEGAVHESATRVRYAPFTLPNHEFTATGVLRGGGRGSPR